MNALLALKVKKKNIKVKKTPKNPRHELRGLF